jgi:nitrate reductase NapE component
MGRSEIVMIIKLVLGLVIALLIISNKLGEYSWIIWLLAIVFGIYKINKEGFDF